MNDEEETATRKPLTRDEARALIAALPKTPYHWVVVAQLLVGMLGAGVAYAITGRVIAAWSAMAAGLIAALPAALMLYGVSRSSLRHSIIGPMVWLMVKLAATLLMFLLVIRALGRPDWPVLLITLIVALKMYWIVVIASNRPVKKKPEQLNTDSK
jgi:ATP synthase protein I